MTGLIKTPFIIHCWSPSYYFLDITKNTSVLNLDLFWTQVFSLYYTNVEVTNIDKRSSLLQ
jgi:hypothetical protein